MGSVPSSPDAPAAITFDNVVGVEALTSDQLDVLSKCSPDQFHSLKFFSDLSKKARYLSIKFSCTMTKKL